MEPKLAKFRQEGVTGWVVTDFTMEQIERKLKGLKEAEDDVRRYREAEKGCGDRNHNGLDRVMHGARLPDAEFGQDAAFFAFVLGKTERELKKMQALRDAASRYFDLPSDDPARKAIETEILKALDKLDETDAGEVKRRMSKKKKADKPSECPKCGAASTRIKSMRLRRKFVNGAWVCLVCAYQWRTLLEPGEGEREPTPFEKKVPLYEEGKRKGGGGPQPGLKFRPCALCEREAPWTKHHLIPKSQGGTTTAKICRECHQEIHFRFTNKELATKCNTLKKIAEDPRMEKWLEARWKEKP